MARKFNVNSLDLDEEFYVIVKPNFSDSYKKYPCTRREMYSIDSFQKYFQGTVICYEPIYERRS